ncbi:MAG: aminotransferase class III-fold pyridoxal phosphate-dependent enzyme [Bacteroidota bacterium]
MKKIRLDKAYHKAEGDYLYYKGDHQQEVKVVDFLGGYGAAIFGHNHPELLQVMQSNIDQQVPFNAQASIRSGASQLAESLNQWVHASTHKNFVTTLGNSGAEAVEAAIKHAELAQQERIATLLSELNRKAIQIARKLRLMPYSLSSDMAALLARRGLQAGAGTPKEIMHAIIDLNREAFDQTPSFLCLNRSFHGKTNGALRLTENPDYRQPFRRLGKPSTFIEPEDNHMLLDAISAAKLTYFIPTLLPGGVLDIQPASFTNVAALFIEPVQGEGGIRPISRQYLQLCRSLADAHDFALVFDEIQCGMGRTGRFLASERSNVVADYYLLGKSLGGGLSKVSAFMVREELYQSSFGMVHTSTFAEDDWSANVALRSLQLLEEQRALNKCKIRGNYLMIGLEDLKRKYPQIIREVSGTGLMIGIQFADFSESPSFVLRALAQQKLLGYVVSGFLLNNFGIRVAPTLSSAATIRLEPSYDISKQACQQLLTALDRLCEVLQKQNSYFLLSYTLKKNLFCHANDIENYAADNAHHAAPVGGDQLNQVGFIGHFIHADHLALWDPSFEEFSPDERKLLLNRFHDVIEPCVYDKMVITSANGERTQFNFIGLFIDSDLIIKGIRERKGEVGQRLIQQAVSLAEQQGFKTLGFGGFSSIISRNCKSVDSWDVAMTTGNSYTVASGVQAMAQAAEAENILPEHSHLAAIGAGGNICSIYCELMAETVPKITLIAREGRGQTLVPLASKIYGHAFLQIKNSKKCKDLQGIASAILHTKTIQLMLDGGSLPEDVGRWIHDQLLIELGDRAPLQIAEDLTALKDANLIVAASNSPEPIIFPDTLGEHPTIICDIAVPQDVDDLVKLTKSNVTVIGGGIIELPKNPNFRLGGVPLNPGEAYACMSETMLLGLEDISEHFSYGCVEKTKVKLIAELAQKHGFSIGKLKTEKSF